jgi:predicted O-linked N-acetylglucosamine transferase (SPINDLY family)
VDKAAELAADHVRLTGLRHGLRERMRNSALGNGALFCRTLEQAFREMWLRWLEQSSGT